MTAMTGGSGLAPESIGGLGLRPNVLRGLRTAASIPGLSMTRAVIVLVGCLVLSAVLFPTLLRLPRWIEFELVVAAWWVVWVVALTYLLYTGRGLIDDFRVEQLPRFGRRHAASPSTSTAMIIRPGPTDHMAPPIPLPLAPGATVDELQAAKQAALAQGGAESASSPTGPATSAMAEPLSTAAERRPDAHEPTLGDTLADAAGEALSSVDISNVDLPRIDLPRIDLPRIDLPDVSLPTIHPPELSLPAFELPDIKLPDLDLGDGGGDGDGIGGLLIGILIAIVVAIVMGLIVFVAVQFVIPALAVGTYALIRAMIERVRGQGGAWAGDLRRSLVRGVTWATVYTAPFALVVWLGHVLL